MLGLEVAHARLDGFAERGSELSLTVDKTDQTTTSLEAGVRARFGSDQVGGWTVSPTAELSYIRFLDHPSASSEASLFQFEVAQRSAFGSQNLGRAAFDLAAHRGPFSVQAGVEALVGGRDATGVGGRLVLGYSF
jgi:uncharacterized protein with beta-barrel porin domain